MRLKTLLTPLLALVFCGEEGVRQFTHFETVE